MSSIYDKLSREDLEAKLKETSTNAPDYTYIKSALERNKEKKKSEIQKESGMDSKEFDALFEDVRKWKRDENFSYEEIINSEYGPLKDQDPDLIKSIYNIAKLPGKNIIDNTSGILRTNQARVFPNWEDIKTAGGKIEDFFFASGNAAENKGSFILPEKKYRTSDPYDEIGQHSERRIREKQFSENYDYDKGNFVGIDNIEPSLGMDGFLDIDGIETPGKYITYEPKEAQTWLQKQLEKHNAAQRAYNDTTGLNTNYYAGSLQGNIDTAARVGRRNQARIDNVLGDFISGKSKMSIPGRHNLVGFLGTPKQQEIYLHEYGKQTGMNPNGTQWSNPYVDQSLYNNPDKGGIIGTIDPYGNTITRDTINQDVTGMYTPSGSSGMDDIADVTSSASVDDSWGDVDGVSYIARGGMVKDAPRYRYAEGGIVNLLPKGAW